MEVDEHLRYLISSGARPDQMNRIYLFFGAARRSLINTNNKVTSRHFQRGSYLL